MSISISVKFGAWCGALCRCKARVLSKQTKQRFGVLCGLPVKKSISVGIKSMSVRAGCGQFVVLC